MKDNVTCKSCGTVSFLITLKEAKAEIRRFNRYYNSLSKAVQKKYYGGNESTLQNYRCCLKMDLRKSKKGDCPNGCTISPVVKEMTWVISKGYK